MVREFDPIKTEKPWGYELLVAQTPHYVGKILHVRAGHALSLQYHRIKDETIHLFSGEALVHFQDGQARPAAQRVGPGASFHIPPGAVHRLEAVTDCDFFEVSTPHLEDVVRLEDRYGRTPG
ncbi:MAG: cupin domain-containing protein [Chloroflexi bacterium]|nr:cupin domain-containing protein [Chloroflexota bacterium]